MHKSLKRRSFILVLHCLLLMSIGLAPGWGMVLKTDRRCGTYPGRIFDEVAKHRFRVREMERAIREGRLKMPEAGPLSLDVGDIAVIQDDGTLISGAVNPFDLRGRSLRFVPRTGGGYDLSISTSAIDSSYVKTVTLKDDDSLQIALSGFAFPFFGTRYNAVYLNTDGNLTFNAGDNASSDRNLSRFRSGPPRIAGFFSDLNPEQGGKVYADVNAERALFTWDRVPEFDIGNANTFQIMLSASGEIRITFGAAMNAVNGIVGLAPGGSSLEIALVNYNVDLPRSIPSGAFAEVFSLQSSNEIDLFALAQVFYRNHPDDYDDLVVFSIPQVDLGQGVMAFFSPSKNEIRGLGDLLFNGTGDDLFDFSSEYGSRGRLQGLLNMNMLSLYPNDFNQNLSVFGSSDFSTLDVMAHEIAHRWGVFLQIKEDGVLTNSLLTTEYDPGHWSFFVDTDASFLYGNDIRDNGDGTFTTVGVTQRYSRIEQYLMGLRKVSDVPPFFYVKNPTSTSKTADSKPQNNVTFRGTKRTVTIDDIIDANGPRIPDADHSPRTFRQAFIMLVGKNDPLKTEDLQKMERLRAAWVDYFRTSTDNLGSADTSLRSTAGTVTYYVPFMEGDAQRYTGIAVANRDTMPATLTFTAYASDGQPLVLPGITNPSTVTLSGGEQKALLDAQLFKFSLSADRKGWIKIVSSSDRVTAFYLAGDLAQTYLDGAIAADRLLANSVFTRIFEGPGALFEQEARTQISIVNPSSIATRVSLRYFNVSGSMVAATERNIPPQGRLAEYFRDLFPNVPLPVNSGYIEVNALNGLAGVEMVRFGQSLFTLPGQERKNVKQLYSAQFASGGAGVFPTPYFTNLKLVNFGDTAASVKIRIVAENGSLLQATGVTNPIDRTIPPHGELSGNASELFGFPIDRLDATPRVGSVIVDISAGSILGDVTFGDAVSGRIIAGLPLESRLFNEMIFSQVAQGASSGVNYFTGLAVLNPGSKKVPLVITVYDENGRLTGVNYSTELPPGQRFSKTLSEIIPGIAGQQRGYVMVSALGGTGVAIFELFGDAGLQRFLAAVPPQAYAIAP